MIKIVKLQEENLRKLLMNPSKMQDKQVVSPNYRKNVLYKYKIGETFKLL